ncbi:MAG TPA: hypothetical protein VEI97_14540 [bacterium]|nr:hypothetical protein [bacterium]
MEELMRSLERLLAETRAERDLCQDPVSAHDLSTAADVLARALKRVEEIAGVGRKRRAGR